MSAAFGYQVLREILIGGATGCQPLVPGHIVTPCRELVEVLH